MIVWFGPLLLVRSLRLQNNTLFKAFLGRTTSRGNRAPAGSAIKSVLKRRNGLFLFQTTGSKMKMNNSNVLFETFFWTENVYDDDDD